MFLTGNGLSPGNPGSHREMLSPCVDDNILWPGRPTARPLLGDSRSELRPATCEAMHNLLHVFSIGADVHAINEI